MRPATKAEILRALTLLSALRKPKDLAGEISADAYEIALDGVSAVALEVATQKLLRASKFMPSPSELYSEVSNLEPGRPKPGQSTPDPDDDVLTPGQKLGYPLIKDLPPEERAAAIARCDALWAKVRPTLTGLKSFDDADADMRRQRREHENAIVEKQIAEAKVRDKERNPTPAMTEAERLERIKQRGHEPTQPTDALLRSLKSPMHPPQE